MMDDGVRLRIGRKLRDLGSRKRCVPTSYTKEEIHEVMQDVGKIFCLEKIEWDSITGEAILHLLPDDGVDWEHSLIRISE